MNILQFLASIVWSLAWPVTVLIAIHFLRKPIIELIPLLRKLKFKEFEAEFRDALESTPPRPPAKDFGDAIVAKNASSLLKADIHYYRLAEVSQRSAILEAWLEVESASSDAYANIVQPGMKIFLNPREITQYLYKKNLISEDDFKLYQNLSQLRNKVAHEIDFQSMNPTVVKEYIDFCLALAGKIRGLR